MITDPRLDLKLFLEDSECSVISANVSTAVRMSATVTVLATRQVRKIKTMTNVVIGYRDKEGNDPGLASHSHDGITYSVLFVGMVTGITLSRTPSNRTATLRCEGHQTLLDRHYTYISNEATQLWDHKRDFIGAASFLSTNLKAGGLAKQISAIYKDKLPPVTPGLSTLSGPPKGTIKLIEKCIGVTLPYGSKLSGKTHGAQHEFFAHASRQCRLLYQIGGISTDSSALNLITKDSTSKVLSNAASKLSDLTTLNTVIDILLRKMYYKFVAIGAPSPHITRDTGEGVQKTAKLNSLLSDFYANAETMIVAGAPLPDVTKICDFKALSDRLGSLEGDELRKEFTQLLTNGVDGVPSPEFKAELDGMNLSTSDKTLIQGNTVSALTPMLNAYIEGEDVEEKDALSFHASIKSLLSSLASKTPVTLGSSQNFFMRVISYLTIPELEFCTPPSCNVLFPSQISSFSLNIPKFNLPTRLLLHVNIVEGGGDGGAAGYYAPSFGLLSDHQGKVAKDSAHSVPLFKHEHFTGVVPAFASLSYYEKFITDSASKEDKLRIANYNLVRQRYQPVTLSASGPFNPFPAVGFPMSIIDVDDVTKESPSIYVGMLANISHTYDSGGSSMTSYSLTHVREVDEIDEVFQDNELRSRSGSTQATPVNDIDLPKGEIKSAFMQMCKESNESSSTLNPFKVSGNSAVQTTGGVHSLADIFHSTKKLGSNTIHKASDYLSVVNHVKNYTATTAQNYRVLAVDWEVTAVDPSVVNKMWWKDQVRANMGDPKELAKVFKDNPLQVSLAELVSKFAQIIEPYKADLHVQEKFNLAKEASSLLGKNDVKLDVDSEYTKVLNGSNSLNGLSIIQLIEELHIIQFPAPNSDIPALSLLQCVQVDFSRMEKMINDGKTSFFGNSISIPSDVFSSATLYLDASVNPVTGPPAPNVPSGPTAINDIAIEEVYRPPWLGDDYSIKNIGDRLYFPTLHVGSVQDRLLNRDYDTTVNENGGLVFAHSTQKSLLNAYQGYNRLKNSELRDRYVSSYVRRPIANVLDVIEEMGLLKTPLAEPLVVDYSKECAPGTSPNPAQVSHTTTKTTVDGEALINEKRQVVKSYISSTKGDAFT